MRRAAARLKLRDFAAALQDAEGALAVEPRWPKALYRQAAALHGLGHTAAAAAAARAALTEEPGNRDVLSLLEQLEADATAASAAAGGPAAPPAAAHKPAPTAALLPPRLAVAPWEYVPPADGVCENLLLLLHGLGDRPAAFARMGRQMALPQVRRRRAVATCALGWLLASRGRWPQTLAGSFAAQRAPCRPSQTAALALGGPQEVPLSDGGRSWYTVFDDSFELIQVCAVVVWCGEPFVGRRLHACTARTPLSPRRACCSRRAAPASSAGCAACSRPWWRCSSCWQACGRRVAGSLTVCMCWAFLRCTSKLQRGAC